MGFGRRSRKHNWERERRDNRRKGKSPPKLILVGAIVLLITSLLALYGMKTGNSDIGITGIAGTIVGLVILFFSLSKRKRKFIANVLDPCQCCKCTNCGRNHNHWTHD